MSTGTIILLVVLAILIIAAIAVVLVINCNTVDMSNKKILWADKKRTLFGFPISTTSYSLTDERLIVRNGFLNKTENEVRLYRILDLQLTVSLWQRIFKVGTINCVSSDKTSKSFKIECVKQPEDIKELLSKLIEEQRDKKRVSSREFMNIDDDYEDFDDNNN